MHKSNWQYHISDKNLNEWMNDGMFNDTPAQNINPKIISMHNVESKGVFNDIVALTTGWWERNVYFMTCSTHFVYGYIHPTYDLRPFR